MLLNFLGMNIYLFLFKDFMKRSVTFRLR